ncbi:hypothetical protein KYC5002_43115 [Archangium violaceum]|uniref:hypothetical protein n=1 Tax=Archangium violaceum TaxID=83451 RepID=UPI002B32428A|nr:hypothetical protein KYC5002_43115 [Archangium gephyra]
MRLHAALLALVLVSLATACHEDVLLPPLEEEPPPFAISLYLEGGQLRPNADVLLVRRPKHLERVYALSRAGDKEPGREQARQLFGIIEAEFRGAGVYVANQVVSLRCAAVELPDCVPRWGFIEELLGPGEGPGSRRLRQVLADSFEKTARQRGMENTLVLATVNVLLTRGMLKSALDNVTAAEARAALAEHRAMVEGPGEGTPAPRQPVTPAAAPVPAQATPAPGPGPLSPSPGLVQALTGNNPTPQVARGPRLLQDVAVKPEVPKELRTTRPIGSSPSQNAQVQADVQYLQNLGATNIRVNQQQLMVENRQRVGVNRPDLQFDYNGRRYHVEYDTPVSGRGPAHQSRATSNDPNAEIILLIVP